MSRLFLVVLLAALLSLTLCANPKTPKDALKILTRPKFFGKLVAKKPSSASNKGGQSYMQSTQKNAGISQAPGQTYKALQEKLDKIEQAAINYRERTALSSTAAVHRGSTKAL